MAREPRLTISELTRRIKNTLEGGFPFVEVEGEASNVRPSAAGHIYFTLKDDSASLQAVMFRSRSSHLPFTLEDGQLVNASGSISVYPPRGNYQIIVESMVLGGTGSILAELEKRKQRLAAEGLFDVDRKQRLPLLPKRVAVVTSPTGAALRDILQVLARRNSGVDVTICPTAVQGDSAGGGIARMIRIADKHNLGDVIIVGRGGGSVEDLLPFSDEAVVRAVADSETPVISAVGHEIDWALVDFAADHRAPTPSAAAELVTSSREEMKVRVMEHGSSIIGTFAGRMASARILVNRFAPDELHRSYEILAQPVLQEFDRLQEELVLAMTERTREARHKLELLRTELESCSPYDILRRGYAVVRTADGSVLTSSSQVQASDDIAVRLSSGELTATVKEVHHEL